MTSEDARIAQIQERTEKATKGPWVWRDCYDSGDCKLHQSEGLDADCENIDAGRIELQAEGSTVVKVWAAFADDSGLEVSRDDARFIEHAREDIPYLLDRVAALTQALEEARQQLQVARAEVNVLRGVHCCADGDGPCGVCLKCARAEVFRLREALHRIQAQCAGHADEFSQRVWMLASVLVAPARPEEGS